MSIVILLDALLAASALLAATGLGLAFKRLTRIGYAQSAKGKKSAVSRQEVTAILKETRTRETDIEKNSPQPDKPLEIIIGSAIDHDQDAGARDARRRLQALAPFLAAAAIVVVIGGLISAASFTSFGQGSLILPNTAVCQTHYSAILYMSPQSGSPVDTKVLAACRFESDRVYLIIEKVINVSSSTNPHPVWFIKANLPHLVTGQTVSNSLVLNEPVGTEADFYVISVTHQELADMESHQVVDQGILQLPPGTRQESAIEVHVKTA